MFLGRQLLSSTLLLAKLMNTIFQANIQDSTVVFNWLDGSPRRYRTYVGNRIASVLKLLQTSCWKHVPTDENPAESASIPTQLIEHSLWWNGPPWLHQEPPTWPTQPTLDINEGKTEMKSECHVYVRALYIASHHSVDSNRYLPGFFDSHTT